MVPVAAATASKDEGVALANLRSRLCFVNQRTDSVDIRENLRRMFWPYCLCDADLFQKTENISLKLNSFHGSLSAQVPKLYRCIGFFFNSRHP